MTLKEYTDKIRLESQCASSMGIIDFNKKYVVDSVDDFDIINHLLVKIYNFILSHHNFDGESCISEDNINVINNFNKSYYTNCCNK